MKFKKLRDAAFYLHRYLGLTVGIILIIVGLTGSTLVFQQEIDRWLLNRQIEPIIPQGDRLSIESVIDTVKATYADRPNLSIQSIDFNLEPNAPLQVWMSQDDQWTEVNINPYTGVILGTRSWENSFFGIIYRLHYALLAGKTGQTLVGIAALLLFILSVTGIILWSGWRKLISGFKVKWLAHAKRVNFDIHKLVGILAAIFLGMISLTGFCWNFSEFTTPVIYAATFTPQPVEPTLQVVASHPRALSDLLSKASAVLPEAITTEVYLPQTPESPLKIRKKFPDEINRNHSEVYIDQYTGDVLSVRDARSLPLAEKVLGTFTLIHYGTFGGLPTRILYVFVGLSPLILFITGFVMWWYRRRPQANHKINPNE
jgi:uncharacterized iron-regulated membrane protein